MFRSCFMIIVLTILLFHNKMIALTTGPVFSFVHDLVQHNVAGAPSTHRRTEWNFDPEIGKKRRIRYEQENGHLGENAIAKVGMGIGYEGPWGRPVQK